ncbi:type VI secretion system lysozyme-like protein [Bradyrhizobium sp. i1.4.4]
MKRATHARSSIYAMSLASGSLQGGGARADFQSRKRCSGARFSHDLETLLNTIALESTLDLNGHDCVRTSILNFGFPDIAHRSIDEVADDELTDALRETLTTYEPRLDRNTIRVRRDGSVGPEQLKLRFIVHADLKAEPLNVPVEFVADVDLDSGDIQINRL